MPILEIVLTLVIALLALDNYQLKTRNDFLEDALYEEDEEAIKKMIENSNSQYEKYDCQLKEIQYN